MNTLELETIENAERLVGQHKNTPAILELAIVCRLILEKLEDLNSEILRIQTVINDL